MDKTKKRINKYQIAGTDIIFLSKINAKSEISSFYPGCWDCKVDSGRERTEKFLSCKYIFHAECLNNINYDDLEFKFLSSCNFCSNND